MKIIPQEELVRDFLHSPSAFASDDDLLDYLADLPETIIEHEHYFIDFDKLILIPADYGDGYQFDSIEELDKFLDDHRADDPRRGSTGEEFDTPAGLDFFSDFSSRKAQKDYGAGPSSEFDFYDPHKHVFAGVRDKLPEVPLEQKLKHEVYRYSNYTFLKLPTEPDFIRKEGQDMEHCLAWAHNDYCQRMRSGEIEVYSMTDMRDNKPKVDIEVALKKGSYSSGAVQQPTVTQIRGMRNEMPPKDEYIIPLAHFFREYGKDWILSGHTTKNFDAQIDGDAFVKRYNELVK